MTDVQFGSVEAIGTAASYTDATGGLMDYDGANYAQLTAKASGAGASIGWKIRAIVAGVITTLLTFTLGTTNAVFAGNVSAQAVTATSAAINGSATVSGFLTVNTGAGINVPKAGSGTFQTGPFIQISDAASVNGWTWQLNASNGLDLWRLASSASSVAATWSSTGLTIASGLTVTAGGITVSAGDASFAGKLLMGTAGGTGLAIGDIEIATNKFLRAYNSGTSYPLIGLDSVTVAVGGATSTIDTGLPPRIYHTATAQAAGAGNNGLQYILFTGGAAYHVVHANSLRYRLAYTSF